MNIASLMDQALLWSGILAELLILFLLVWVPIAEDLWALRLYLGFSLTRSAALLFAIHSLPYESYIRTFQIASIIGQVLLLLIGVELMAALINDKKMPVAYFYSLAVAALLLSALSELKFPLPVSMTQIAVFTMKAVALTAFVLAFAISFNKKYRWPYSGLAFGLAVMMLLDFLAVLARNWSATHGWEHYGLIRYSFPLASDVGYFLWLRAVIIHKEPKKWNGPPLHVLLKWRDNMYQYRETVKDIIRKRLKSA